ncbi:MAG TPA: SBBP repeat-containing protein [Pyrinomonadaceae bacterium]
MKLVGADKRSVGVGLEELPVKSNYFIGNERSKWQTKVSNYARVKYRGIYPGVDLIYYGTRGQLEYDFEVAPGTHPNAIRLSFEGAKRVRVESDGDLVLDTENGEVRHKRPHVYQDVNSVRRSIPCGYLLDENQHITFDVGDYDRSKPLTIDPVLTYATYLGGSLGDAAYGVAQDAAGNLYVTGITSSINFPTTAGAYQAIYPTDAQSVVFVAKLNPAGTALVYSTYLGGSGHDPSYASANSYGYSIAVDASGNAYVTGDTSAINFPTTAGAFQPTTAVQHGIDAYVTKLSAQGDSLIYSTYLHGPGQSNDYGSAIAIDSSGNAYVTGLTNSTTFPTTAGSFQPTTPASSFPGYVIKLNASGSALVYSSYLGGSTYDYPRSIALDATGNAYVAGGTSSTNFPTTTGAFRTTSAGGGDAFVTKINPAGSALVYSTYLGGSASKTANGADRANDIAVDNSGNAYVTGDTTSANFPTTAGAYRTTAVGGTDAFITKINPSGGALVYSTYLGGVGKDIGYSIDINDLGNAYVSGSSDSSNFPTTSGALQSSNLGLTAFVTKLNLTGNKLVYSTYLGGSANDDGWAIAVQGSGDAYVVGTTRSTNFPVTSGAFQQAHAGGNDDAFVVKLCMEADRGIAADATGTGPNSVTYGDYSFPAALDPTVLDLAYPGEDLVANDPATGRETEIAARLYRPSTLSAGSYPLVIFLHGNHATCGKRNTSPRVDDNSSYTTTGLCPTGYDPVPNHLGYEYLAQRLASWGYIVVSINANRGVTGDVLGPYRGPNGEQPYEALRNDDINLSRLDPSLILTRGRLVLRHLQKLSEWNKNGGAPRVVGDLKGKIDFSNVGFMGHSRGGEGVRAAYKMYPAPGSPWLTRILSPVNIKGVLEIGPVDGFADRVLNAEGTSWNVVLPMCDGDIVDLLGVRPFDRMMAGVIANTAESPPTPKSTYTAWGANHNYFNSQWQRNESNGCLDHRALFLEPGTAGASTQVGSANQQQIGLASVVAFFRANVGVSADPSLRQNFDPLYDLPATVTSITRVDRGFTPSPNSSVTTVFEDFDKATGINTYGFANDVTSGVSVNHGADVVPNHDASLTAAIVSWTAPSSGDAPYFQTNWTEAGKGSDISNYQTLDIRISRQFNAVQNPSTGTTFSIQLVMANGSVSDLVGLCKYAELTGPVGGRGGVGGTPEYGGRHPILQTVRIPLADFANVDMYQVRGVRFVFDGTPTGAIFLANIRLST